MVKDKSKAKRRKLERELRAAHIKEKNQLPKDAFRIEHLNYKVCLRSSQRKTDLVRSDHLHVRSVSSPEPRSYARSSRSDPSS